MGKGNGAAPSPSTPSGPAPARPRPSSPSRGSSPSAAPPGRARTCPCAPPRSASCGTCAHGFASTASRRHVKGRRVERPADQYEQRDGDEAHPVARLLRRLLPGPLLAVLLAPPVPPVRLRVVARVARVRFLSRLKRVPRTVDEEDSWEASPQHPVTDRHRRRRSVSQAVTQARWGSPQSAQSDLTDSPSAAWSGTHMREGQ